MSAQLYDALERAVKTIKEHPELAPATSLSITEDGLWVTPWIMGAPITALLTWHDALSDTEREIEGAETYCKVTVRGLLGDVPVIAQTTTHVQLPGNRVSAAVLRTAAHDEDPVHAPDQAVETTALDGKIQ